jgi:predicted nucleic acid-binding protein
VLRRCVLDSGAVSYLADPKRRAQAAMTWVRAGGSPLVLSMTLVECLQGGPPDAPTNLFLKQCEIVETLPEQLARDAARLRHRAGRGSAVDALVVAFARGRVVVTGDQKDISALAGEANDVQVVTI